MTLRERLHALAAFLPSLECPEFEPGGPNRDAGSEDDVPEQEQSDAVSAFVEAAYDHGWVLEDFDWSAWQSSTEAERLFEEPASVADASLEQIARMLTTIIRRDRFVEGELVEGIRSGLVARIVRRAAALAGEAT